MSDPLRVRLVVNGARSAARAGDLDGAVRLLDELELPDLAVRATPDTSGTPGTSSALDADAAAVVAALDLRARVHAQRGELEEADRCWAAVQEVSPDDQGAEAGRRTIEEIRLGRRRSKPLLHTGWLGVAAAAVAVVALAAGIVVLSPDPAAQGQVAAGTAQPAGPAASRPGSSAEADALREHVAAVEARKAAESERKARQAADRKRELVVIARRLAMPGLIVQRRSQDVRVRFKTGLFPASADIGAAGRPCCARSAAGSRACRWTPPWWATRCPSPEGGHEAAPWSRWAVPSWRPATWRRAAGCRSPPSPWSAPTSRTTRSATPAATAR
ncbi:hypothetical protein ACFQQB_38455 [Nonomuraea rubra]|uniref:hypothetical protein n=1 Tax=Nonomuraea rubra TaxID=46180 RepID=UPI0036186C9F